jgi:hypothetical protein
MQLFRRAAAFERAPADFPFMVAAYHARRVFKAARAEMSHYS